MKDENKIYLLDEIRGIAILMVFLFHGLRPVFGFGNLEWAGFFRNFNVPPSFLLLSPFTFGNLGVAIFFVVSGMCIHISYVRSQNQSLTSFFMKRFFRIYPPYLVALIVFSFCPPWTKIHFATPEEVKDFFYHLFLAQNFSDEYFFGINGSFWSIAVEFQLYLLYPIMFLLVKNLNWTKTLIIIGSLEICLRLFCSYYDTFYNETAPNWVSNSPFIYWFSWSIGAYVGDYWLKKKSIPYLKFPLWMLFIMIIVTKYFKPLEEFHFLFGALATAQILAHLTQNSNLGKTSKPNFVSKHLSFVGIASYSIYLFHQPILDRVPPFLWSISPNIPGLVIYFLSILVWFPIVLASFLLYKYVELPSINLGKRTTPHRIEKV